MEFLTFEVDKEQKRIILTIVLQKFLNRQPKTMSEVDDFCENELFPLLDSIQEICLAHGYTQGALTNLDNFDPKTIKHLILMKIIWSVYNHTKDCILLDQCIVDDRSSFVNALLTAVKGFFPPFMRDMITLAPMN
jgi:hypothetical protein